ncbi:MAG: NADH:ubiquinone reductase (Na(+)-transporting) subunit F [Gammaproteobacteria bacterium]
MSFQLTIEPLGETIEVEEGQRMLDACLRAGIWLPYACNHGLCGTCKVQVVEGEIEHTADASSFALMDIERAEGKCLACSTVLTSDCVIEADVEPEPDARNHPIRDFTARVMRVEALTPTIRGIHLEVPAGLAFQAGQYINVHVPGLAGPRAFSIASPPQLSPQLELNVRRVDGGAATGYLCDTLTAGDTLRCSGPLGRFFVRESAPEPMLFLAGGSGLSSPKSMILDLFGRGEQRPVTLIYGARSRAELYYADLFADLAARHANFTYVPVLSEATPGDAWEGETGFVHDAAARRFSGRFDGMKAYLCGPPAMIEACIRTLMQGRLFERDIFTEKFLTAADGAQAAARSPLFKRL